MPNDIAKTLAAAATGGGAKVIEITLRLKSDPGNSAALKQLGDQVGQTTRRALKDIDELGQKLVSKVGEWAKSIREQLSKPLELPPVNRTAGNGAATTKLEQSPAGQPATRNQSAARGNEPNTETRSDEAGGGKEGKSRFEKAAEAASHLGSLIQRVGVLTAPDEKTAEARSKDLEYFKNLGETAVDAAAVYTFIKESLATAKAGSALSGAAGVGQTAVTIGAMAGSAAQGGLAITPGIAAAGGLLVAGALAAHDGIKLILNSVNRLGGNFDTLTGAVAEWHATVLRNIELERTITIAQEARKVQLEQLRASQETTRSYYEARERIDESKKYDQEVPRLRLVAEHYRQRFSSIDPQHHVTDRELQLQRHDFALKDRVSATFTYRDTFEEKKKEQETAESVARATRGRNLQLQYKPRMQAVMPAENPEQDVPEGFVWGLKKTFGQQHWGMTDAEKEALHKQHGFGPMGMFVRTKDLNQFRLDRALTADQPSAQPAKIDLQEQLSHEEKSLKLANELRDVARDRSHELQNQLQTMDQQVAAAEQQKAIAEQQVKAEQERLISQKANMSMLTKDQQSTAANILKKFNETKHLSRDDALTLQKLGISQGAIGRSINETLAQGLDPERAKQFKQAGGEEDLDKAQLHLRQSTDDLADTQNDANEALSDFIHALGDFDEAKRKAALAQSAFEKTKAARDGARDPTQPPTGAKQGGETAAAQNIEQGIEAARGEFVAAIHDIGNSAVAAIRAGTAEARATAQRLNEAHKLVG
jgi:hypothetical protein